MTPSTTEGLLREALRFANEIAGTYIAPFRGLSGSEECEYSCWGCNGRFMSYAPRWQKPTAKTFTHKSDCRYLAFLAALSVPASPVQGLPPEVEAACRAIESREAQRKREASATLPTPAETVVAYLRSLAALNKEGEAQPPAVMDYDSCIRALAPFLPDGWVAQDKDGETTNLFKMKPGMDEWAWTCLDSENETSLYPFTIPRAADWRSSLRHVVGGKVVVEG